MDPIEMHSARRDSSASGRPSTGSSRSSRRSRRSRSSSPPGYEPQLPQTELKKVLKEHHVNMIAFSACVGIGLFLQSGKVIFVAGPGMAVIAYLLAGSIMWCAISSLGEMTALFPIPGGIFVFPARFLDVGVGYAAGWMSWFAWVIIIASEVLAVAQLFNFRFDPNYLKDVSYSGESLGWKVGQEISPAVWVFVFLIAIFLINCLPVIYYGKLEYIFGCIKMCFIVLLIMFNIIVSASQPVSHQNGEGWTWDDPYSFSSQNITIRGDTPDEVVIGGSSGVFLALWSSITTVVFSMIGFETVSITAAECVNLEETESIKMGTRKICLRIILLYTLGTLVVGFNVPYTDAHLRNLALNAITPGQNSVFILSAVRNNIHGFPHFFNAFFIFSATTSGINSLYLASRILHALASIQEVWPDYGFVKAIKSRLQKTTWGVPHGAVFASWLFGSLAFLAAGKAPSQQLGRMATNSIVSMLIVYATICLAYMQFYKSINGAAEGQNIQVADAHVNRHLFNRESPQYPYKSGGQWLKSVWGFTGCILLVTFNGWQSFVGKFSAPDFVASYISIPIFLLIVMAYHVMHDGWNPLEWKRQNNQESPLLNPPPRTVTLPHRVGHLRLTKGEKLTSKDNTRAIGLWLKEWIK